MNDFRMRPSPDDCTTAEINAISEIEIAARAQAIADFKRLGDKASYHYADDSTKEWDLADKAKADALAIFDAHPELHDELRAIGTGFLWLLGMARPRDGSKAVTPYRFMRSRADLEADGVAALARLIKIAYRDHGGAVRVRKFLLGLYNGDAFKFDLTDLRPLDRNLQEDCMAVLAMDIDGPRVEVHERIPGTSDVIAKWAADAWPEAPR